MRIAIGFATAICVLMALASTASAASSDLQVKLDALAKAAHPGMLGISILDLKSGDVWRVDSTTEYPMMSVFKAPVAATVLSLVDQGKVSLEQTVTLTRADLSPGASDIAKNFLGDSMTFSISDLLKGAVSRSDNTATDALIRFIGGPKIVTDYIKAQGIKGMHVELDERGVSHVFSGLGEAAAPPPNETAEVRNARMERGYAAYLTDPRNRSTPDASVEFLRKLWEGQLLSPASTQHLLDLMYSQTACSRLRTHMPADVRLADKCGTSLTLDGMTPAYNDIGIMTLPGGRNIIIAAFLSGSRASTDDRDKIFIDLASATISALR
ncbi:MAG TPA: class A beta-lactamase [Rhizomicrobium sp.]|nr:class A beta-lactamase [Rhizomicrobium sp.]